MGVEQSPEHTDSRNFAWPTVNQLHCLKIPACSKLHIALHQDRHHVSRLTQQILASNLVEGFSLGQHNIQFARILIERVLAHVLVVFLKESQEPLCCMD